MHWWMMNESNVTEHPSECYFALKFCTDCPGIENGYVSSFYRLIADNKYYHTLGPRPLEYNRTKCDLWCQIMAHNE